MAAGCAPAGRPPCPSQASARSHPHPRARRAPAAAHQLETGSHRSAHWLYTVHRRPLTALSQAAQIAGEPSQLEAAPACSETLRGSMSRHERPAAMSPIWKHCNEVPREHCTQGRTRFVFRFWTNIAACAQPLDTLCGRGTHSGSSPALVKHRTLHRCQPQSPHRAASAVRSVTAPRPLLFWHGLRWFLDHRYQKP